MHAAYPECMFLHAAPKVGDCVSSFVLAGGDEQIGLVSLGFTFRLVIFFWFGSNLLIFNQLEAPAWGLAPSIKPPF